MGFTNFILVVIFILIIGCICGGVLSYKNERKRKKMQRAADYNFQTSYGHYKFHYMVKSFKKEDGLTVKIIVDPVLGFSDLSTSNTNAITNMVGYVNGVEYPVKPQLHALNGNIDIEIPASALQNGVYSAKIKVVTTWNLGGDSFDNVLEFDFEK